MLLVTVDALRLDRLGAGGHRHARTPMMDRLLYEGLSFTRCFAAGCPTQFALPAIHTSTLPLDHGGYGLGIRDRPAALAEAFRGAGYRTIGISTAFWGTDLFGYDRGFERWVNLVSPALYVSNLRKNVLEYFVGLCRERPEERERCSALLKPFVARYLESLVLHLDERASEAAAGTPCSPVVHGGDLTLMQELARRAEDRFEADPDVFVAELLATGGAAELDRLEAERTRPGRLASRIDRAAGVADRLVGGLRASAEGEVAFPFRRPYRGVSAGYASRRLREEIEADDGRPFFAWLHLMDVHDGVFLPHDLGVGRILAEARRALGHLRAIRRSEPYRGEAAYDLAVAYVDRCLAGLVASLNAAYGEDGMLVVLTGDHGSGEAGEPRRRVQSVVSFDDELYHVPMAFRGGVEPASRNEPVSTLDLAPTLLALAGIPAPDGFAGESLFPGSRDARRVLVAEHMGRGPCDFGSKPILTCIRREGWKAVFRTLPGNGSGPEMVELYDLDADPRGERNLADRLPVAPAAEVLEAVARDRLASLRVGRHGAGV